MIDDILEERGARYGSFVNVGAVSQALKDVLRSAPNWHLLKSYQKESLEMDCNKTARIVCGLPCYKDSWVDKAGYATLVANELEE